MQPALTVKGLTRPQSSLSLQEKRSQRVFLLPITPGTPFGHASCVPSPACDSRIQKKRLGTSQVKGGLSILPTCSHTCPSKIILGLIAWRTSLETADLLAGSTTPKGSKIIRNQSSGPTSISNTTHILYHLSVSVLFAGGL